MTEITELAASTDCGTLLSAPGMAGLLCFVLKGSLGESFC